MEIDGFHHCGTGHLFHQETLSCHFTAHFSFCWGWGSFAGSFQFREKGLLSSWGAWASAVVAQVSSCSVAWNLSWPGSNLCSHDWQADSYPLGTRKSNVDISLDWFPTEEFSSALYEVNVSLVATFHQGE